jgi:hypothetical protein
LAQIRPCNATSSCLAREGLEGIRGGLAGLDCTGVIGRVSDAVGSDTGVERLMAACVIGLSAFYHFLCTFLVMIAGVRERLEVDAIVLMDPTARTEHSQQAGSRCI